MHLLVINLKNESEFKHVIHEINDAGLNGIVLPSVSVHNAMHEDSVEAVPVFGFLTKISRRHFDSGHTLMMLVEADKMEQVKQKVRDIVKDLTHKGVMFSVPVNDYEGL